MQHFNKKNNNIITKFQNPKKKKNKKQRPLIEIQFTPGFLLSGFSFSCFEDRIVL